MIMTGSLSAQVTSSGRRRARCWPSTSSPAVSVADELENRLGWAMRAVTEDELRQLIADLPRSPSPSPIPTPTPPPVGGGPTWPASVVLAVRRPDRLRGRRRRDAAGVGRGQPVAVHRRVPRGQRRPRRRCQRLLSGQTRWKSVSRRLPVPGDPSGRPVRDPPPDLVVEVVPLGRIHPDVVGERAEQVEVAVGVIVQSSHVETLPSQPQAPRRLALDDEPRVTDAWGRWRPVFEAWLAPKIARCPPSSSRSAAFDHRVSRSSQCQEFAA